MQTLRAILMAAGIGLASAAAIVGLALIVEPISGLPLAKGAVEKSLLIFMGASVLGFVWVKGRRRGETEAPPTV
jgi:hypothetical protein